MIPHKTSSCHPQIPKHHLIGTPIRSDQGHEAWYDLVKEVLTQAMTDPDAPYVHNLGQTRGNIMVLPKITKVDFHH